RERLGVRGALLERAPLRHVDADPVDEIGARLAARAREVPADPSREGLRRREARLDLAPAVVLARLRERLDDLRALLLRHPARREVATPRRLARDAGHERGFAVEERD